MARRLTPQQGQLLAYVYYYTKVHRVPPSENESAAVLGIQGPSAHASILRLEANGSLSRMPGQPRTIKVLVPREELPELE